MEDRLSSEAEGGRRSAAAANAGAIELRPWLPNCRCWFVVSIDGLCGEALRGVAAPDLGVNAGLSAGLSFESVGPTWNLGIVL